MVLENDHSPQKLRPEKGKLLTAFENETQQTALSKSPRPIMFMVARLTEFHTRTCG
jgi:hypothetical protein